MANKRVGDSNITLAELEQWEVLAQKAAPRPWRWGTGPYGYDEGLISGEAQPNFSNNNMIFGTYRGPAISDEDRDYLVECVNNYERLIAAIRRAAGWQPREIY